MSYKTETLIAKHLVASSQVSGSAIEYILPITWTIQQISEITWTVDDI